MSEPAIELHACPLNAPLSTRITVRACVANRARAALPASGGKWGAERLVAGMAVEPCRTCPGLWKLHGLPEPPAYVEREARQRAKGYAITDPLRRPPKNKPLAQPKAPKPQPHKKLDRNAELVAAVDAGETAAAVARRYGIAATRVRAIVARERKRAEK